MFSFRLGTIPVRVHFWFFLTALMLGGSGRPGPLVLSWVAIVFVSVILHELGHALVGRAFGMTPQIDLHAMGGLTSWAGGRNLGPGPSILVSLAGPLTGIAFGGLAFVLARTLPLPPVAAGMVGQFVWVNAGWGLFNLLPILPLDGGNVLWKTLDIFTGNRGRRPAHVVSVLIAGAILVAIVVRDASAIAEGRFGDLWLALIATMFLVQNVRALRPAPPR